MHEIRTEPGPEHPTVPGYQVDRLLGRGGQSEVWLATTADGQPAALKVLAVGASRRELEALRRHRHPHLVGLQDVARTSDDRPVLVLDYVSGGSLAQLVAARGPFEPGEVVTMVTPLAELLSQLHATGVVHADVTPGNILFGQDGRPLLCDLGIAMVAGVEPRTHGTDGFSLDAGDGPSADVYGLAACAWLALTGTVPGSGAVRPPLCATHPQLPIELVDVIEQSMLADPDRRPAAAELARRIFAAEPAQAVRLVPVDPLASPIHVVTQRLRRREPQAWEAMVSPGAADLAGELAAVRAAGRSAPQGDVSDAAAPFDRLRLRRTAPQPRRRLPSRRVLLAMLAILAGLGSGAAAATWWSPGADTAQPVARRPSDNGGPTTPDPASADQASADPASADQASADPASADQASVDSAPADATAEVLTTVQELSDRRARALSAADRAALATVDAPGSPAMAADLDLLDQLDRRQVRLQGLSFRLTDLSVLAHDGSSATVLLTTTTNAHQVAAAGGQTLTAVPASQPQAVQVVLVRDVAGWQVSEVRAAA